VRFAILGVDAETIELAHAARHRGHALVAGCEVSPAVADDWAALAPAARRTDDWEAALDGQDDIDAAIIGRGANDETRADQLRLLMQAAMPLIVVHPIHPSMLVYYELDMIRREAAPVIVPYAPQHWHPAVQRLAELTHGPADQGWGGASQIAIERSLADRSRACVLDQYVRDMELFRGLAQEVSKVGAMSSTPSDFSNLSVQMSGSTSALVRWSVVPAGASSGARLVVAAMGGNSATLVAPDGDEPWTLELRQQGKTTTETFADWDGPLAAIERFEAAMTGGPIEPDWTAASQDLELADAVERSLRRGRTVELHYEDHTEEASFKGIMAAGGCGLLLLALLLVVAATTAAHFGLPLAQFWPVGLLLVLGAFLAMQFLTLAFPRNPSPPA